MSDVDAILKDRGATYGNFLEQAMVAQALKDTIFSSMIRKGTVRIMAADQTEALEMIAVKLARIACGDAGHVDSWADIAGYAMLVANRLEEKRI